MRIWDIKPCYLCRKHLLGEHGELHALWSVIINNKKGFSRHPETKRWVGKLRALYLRHDLLVIEMNKRGYFHKTPLDKNLAKGKIKQNKLLQSIKEQEKNLKSRCPFCFT